MADTRGVLEVKNFAQIRKARIEFGDVTVLVGPQATGKSLILQLLKAAIDGSEIAWRLKSAGLRWDGLKELYELYLGEGMGRSWRSTSSLRWNSVTPFEHVTGERLVSMFPLFYVPAQRALILSEGWPRPFDVMDARTPVVARLFSEELYRLLSYQRGRDLFPDRRRLSSTLVQLIDQSLLHGARVGLRTWGKAASKLELLVGRRNDGIQFPAWSTGQREFMPLLLGLYSVLPTKGYVARAGWVVIEEPEMGLHPRGIEVAMLLVLELLRHRIKVVLSTHSPVVLEVIWGIQRLAERRAKPTQLLEVFGVQGKKDLLPLARRALAANYRVFSLNYEGASVVSRDISGLDAASENHAEAFWGGLTELGSRVSDLVTRLSR